MEIPGHVDLTKSFLLGRNTVDFAMLAAVAGSFPVVLGGTAGVLLSWN